VRNPALMKKNKGNKKTYAPSIKAERIRKQEKKGAPRDSAWGRNCPLKGKYTTATKERNFREIRSSKNEVKTGSRRDLFPRRLAR